MQRVKYCQKAFNFALVLQKTTMYRGNLRITAGSLQYTCPDLQLDPTMICLRGRANYAESFFCLTCCSQLPPSLLPFKWSLHNSRTTQYFRRVRSL